MDGSFKINCDASFSKSGTTIACVVRDASGMLIDFFGKNVDTSSAMVTEALAIREATIFYLKVVFSRVAIESNSANVLAWCSYGGLELPWVVAPIIHDVSSLLRNVDVLFSHIRHLANKVANFVARYVNRHG